MRSLVCPGRSHGARSDGRVSRERQHLGVRLVAVAIAATISSSVPGGGRRGGDDDDEPEGGKHSGPHFRSRRYEEGGGRERADFLVEWRVAC